MEEQPSPEHRGSPLAFLPAGTRPEARGLEVSEPKCHCQLKRSRNLLPTQEWQLSWVSPPWLELQQATCGSHEDNCPRWRVLSGGRAQALLRATHSSERTYGSKMPMGGVGGRSLPSAMICSKVMSV